MLKGQAKTDYQREYMRRKRAGLTGSNTMGLTDKLKAVGQNIEGNRIKGVWRNVSVCGSSPQGQGSIPCTPAIDADGNPISDYT